MTGSTSSRHRSGSRPPPGRPPLLDPEAAAGCADDRVCPTAIRGSDVNLSRPEVSTTGWRPRRIQETCCGGKYRRLFWCTFRPARHSIIFAEQSCLALTASASHHPPPPFPLFFLKARTRSDVPKVLFFPMVSTVVHSKLCLRGQEKQHQVFCPLACYPGEEAPPSTISSFSPCLRGKTRKQSRLVPQNDAPVRIRLRRQLALKYSAFPPHSPVKPSDRTVV